MEKQLLKINTTKNREAVAKNKHTKNREAVAKNKHSKTWRSSC